MDIASLSQAELLKLIIYFGAGSVAFALIFIVTLVFSLRRRSAKAKLEKTLAQKTNLSASVRQTEVKEGVDMGLLKSMGEKASGTTENKPVTSQVELLSIWLNPQTKEISVKVDHRQYTALTDVTERHIGQRILESAAALLAFTRGIIATADGTKSLPIPNVTISEMPSSKKVDTPSPAEPVEKPLDVDEVARQQFLQSLAEKERALNIVEPEPQPETKSRWSFGRKAKKPETPQSLLEPFNLVEQIDEILQQKLLMAGETRQIGIQSVPGGGMRIHIENEVYNSLDAVADADVKAMIQSAIKAWEAR